MKSELLAPYGSVIAAAGEGSRFRGITQDRIPKPLQPVGEKLLIEHTLTPLDPAIVNRLVFVVGHRGEAIQEWVIGANLPHEIVNFSKQKEPGFLGAVTAGVSRVKEDSLIISTADEIKDGLDLEGAIYFHSKLGRKATIVATYNNNLYRERLLTVRESDGQIMRTELHPEKYQDAPEEIGLVNTGFLIMDREALGFMDTNYSTEFGGIMDPLVDAGEIGAYIDPHMTYFNVGTPEEYFAALQFLGVKQE